MMAGRNHHRQAAAAATKQAAFRLLGAPIVAVATDDDADEFTESDIWGCRVDPAPDHPRGRAIPDARGRRPAPAPADHRAAAAPASMPVRIPDWSKILGGCADSKTGAFCWADGGGGDEELLEGGRRMVPPHELLWRTRGASMSVHEGIGRTLKGRDLRRLRNAVWEITGFQD